MTRALLILSLALAACGTGPTALNATDGGGHNDASINGGGTGGSSGMGGVTGGSGGAGGTVGIDAGPYASPDAGKKDAQHSADAGNVCETTCRALEMEYGAAVRQAQICEPAAAKQCAHTIPGGLACGCPVWVNQTTTTDSIRARYQEAGCNRCLRACPAIACIAPGMGVCTPVSPMGEPARLVIAPPRGMCMTKS